MLSKNAISIFENCNDRITIKYLELDSGDRDPQMISIHPDDLMVISRALAEISHELNGDQK